MVIAAASGALRIVIPPLVRRRPLSGAHRLSVPRSTVLHTPRRTLPLHSPQEVETVLRLIADGWNNCQIYRATRIPVSTIRTWRHGHVPRIRPRDSYGIGRRPSSCPRCDISPLDEPAYAYLLGLYLGDGHIVKCPRAYRLEIVQDARYAQLINLAHAGIARVLPDNRRVGRVAKPGCVVIYAYWQHWPCLFPQHGPGRKHDRRIALQLWQQDVVAAYPRQLLRGLIHSYGCRAINWVRKRKYACPRYFFTNTSTDILQIFRDACDAVGIRHRNTKPTAISVARKEDVAALDAFIGPKQ
jgi:hypothetical protein